MTDDFKTLNRHAAEIADLINDDFILLARRLRELQDSRPEIFLKVAELAGLGKRKAFALARISRQFDDRGIPELRLHKIGWTRLQLIGRYLTADNVHQLLKLAEHTTVHDLEVLLRGDAPVENARVMVLYLAPADYNKLAKVLVGFGAAPNGIGLIGTEIALMKLVEQFSKV